MRHRLLAAILVASIFAFAGPAAARFINFVEVGDPGNPSDTLTHCTEPACGTVGTTYCIGKYEVTNAQYAEFLNAVADSDPNALYNTNMKPTRVAASCGAGARAATATRRRRAAGTTP